MSVLKIVLGYGINLKTPIIHLYTDYILILYIYTRVQRVFSDLYNDKNVQTAYKPREGPTRRAEAQISIYTTIGIIHAYSAFSRLRLIKIKHHILLL